VSRRKFDKGLVALRRFRGPTYSEDDIQHEFREIVAFLEIEQELEGSSSFLDCFRGTDLRRTLIIIGSEMSQAFSGIAFISRYSTSPFPQSFLLLTNTATAHSSSGYRASIIPLSL
jgi:SP family sugar:H+ symporter-like MFS transporter